MRQIFLAVIAFSILSSSALAIHGGRDARPGELKSTVALATRNSSGVYKTFCSGTLISKNTVLTAAHCYGHSEQRNVFVVFSQNLKQSSVIASPANKWTLHEKWDEETIEQEDPRNTHDLALLSFTGDIPATNEPAELLTDDSFVKRNTTILVAGYGFKDESLETDQSGWPKMPSGDGVLRSARVKVSDPRFSATEVLTDEFKAGTTSADSGGSAFLRRGTRHYLWGVTSRGMPGEDGVYTRVSLFLDWIRENSKSAP